MRFRRRRFGGRRGRRSFGRRRSFGGRRRRRMSVRRLRAGFRM